MSECGEQASPHLVIDVVIQPAEGAEEARAEQVTYPGHQARGWATSRADRACRERRSGAATGIWRQQAEFRGPPDRCPAAGHRELRVDVLGVRPHRVQGHHEFAGDGGAI
jgi:hypothetical protein